MSAANTNNQPDNNPATTGLWRQTKKAKLRVRRPRTVLCVNQQLAHSLLEERLPGLSALLPNTVSSYDGQTVINTLLAQTTNERVTALAALNTTEDLREELIEQLLKYVTQPLTPVLDEGQVLIVVRRNLRHTTESSWLCNGVFHHVKGTSIVLGPLDATVPAPLRIAPHSTLKDARLAAPLFSELAWGSVMGFEQAWQTATALCR